MSCRWWLVMWSMDSMEGMKWSVAGDEVELAPARVQEGEVVEQVVPAQGEVELAVVVLVEVVPHGDQARDGRGRALALVANRYHPSHLKRKQGTESERSEGSIEERYCY